MFSPKSPRRHANLAALASWIEEPCHFQTKQDAVKTFTSTKSFHYIAAMNDLLQSDSDQSYRLEVGNRGNSDSEHAMDGDQSSASSAQVTHATATPPDLSHHSIMTLLDEYYKVAISLHH